MENSVKKTKMMYFTELREMVIEAVQDQEWQDELVEFIDKQIEAIEKRKEAAAKRAEKKRSESDELTQRIAEIVGDEFITVDAIVEALADESVTRNKVTARLGKLVREGVIVKEPVKVDGAKKMAYRKADAAPAEVEAE